MQTTHVLYIFTTIGINNYYTAMYIGVGMEFQLEGPDIYTHTKKKGGYV